MKKILTLLIFVIACFFSNAATFTVTTQTDMETGCFRNKLSDAVATAGTDTVTFAEDVDTVYISHSYIEQIIYSDVVIQGKKADGRKVVFYFEKGYYMHVNGIHNIKFTNIEFTNDETTDPYTFKLRSDDSSIQTCAMLSADFSTAGQLTIDSCEFNLLLPEHFAKGGALICYGENNTVQNSNFNYTDFYASASQQTVTQPSGGLLYMEGSLLDNCEFNGAAMYFAEYLELTGGVAYCEVNTIRNCKFDNFQLIIETPDASDISAGTFAPTMWLKGGILYAKNAYIEKCSFNSNNVHSTLYDDRITPTNCIEAKGGIVYADNSVIRYCKINNNEIDLKVYDPDNRGVEASAKSTSSIQGGGIYMNGGMIVQTYIQNNISKSKKSSYGGGIYLNAGEIQNSLIADNQAINLGYGIGGAVTFDTDGFVGGGIYATSGSQINFCTIAKNNSQNNGADYYNYGGGIASASDNDITANGLIIWNNSYKTGTYQGDPYDMYPVIDNMTYSGVTGLYSSGGDNFRLSASNSGTSSTQTYPGFMDPDNGNFRFSADSDCNGFYVSHDTDYRFDVQNNEHNGGIGCYAYYLIKSDDNGIIYVKEGALGYGSSWDDATGDLKTAIELQGQNDVIWVATGTYYPSEDDIDEYLFVDSNTELYGGFAGNETQLEQRDIENNPTILSGDLPNSPNNSKRILYNQYGTAGSIIDGFTITEATQTALEYVTHIRNCKITGNNCTSSVIHTGVLENCSIYNNTFSPTERGTSILNAFNNCTNTLIFDNTVNLLYDLDITDHYGVVASQYAGTIENSKIYNNTVNINFDNAALEIVSLSSSIRLKTAKNVVIHDNTINVESGGTYPSTLLQLGQVTADYLTNVTICSNAINVDESFTDLSNANIIKDLTIYYDLYNSVCWNNTTNFIEGEVSSYKIIRKHYGDLIRNFAHEGSIPNTCIDCIELSSANSGSNTSVNYPNFYDYRNGDYSLNSCSALIDGGANYLASGITNDITGENRIFGDSIDIGAYEYKPYVIPDGNGIAYIKENGTGDGSSWENAAANIAKALEVTGVQQIWVAAGTYYPTDDNDREKPFTIPNNMKLYGGFAGTETSIDQRDIENNETILSGDINPDNDEDAFCVVYVKIGADENTIVDGFTVRDGNTKNSYDQYLEEVYGVGIYNYGGLVTNCKVTDNIAYCNTVNPNASDCYVEGVGIHNQGGIIRNCSIIDNEVKLDFDSNGYSVNYSGASVNVAGIGVSTSNNGLIENCLINNNNLTGSADALAGKLFAAELRGAGVFANNSSVTNSIIKVNLAMCSVYSNDVGTSKNDMRGAGIYAYNSTVSNCMFNQNLANALAYGTNSTANSYGGGLYARNNSTFINCTMATNYTGARGDTEEEKGETAYIDNSTIQNCIIWNPAMLTGNLLFNDEGTIEYTAVRDTLFAGAGNMLLSPENTGTNPDSNYVAFVNINGGDDLDLSLQPESACIDAGNNAYVSVSGDLNDSTRIQGSAVDMGCYESFVAPAVPTNVSIENQVIGGAGCYGATQTIVVAEDGNTVEFQSGSSTNFIAQQSIRFLPGTVIRPGAYVHAWITDDGTFCDGLPESIVRVQQPEEKSLEIIPEKEDELELKTLKVYPNPSDGRFTIEIRGAEGSNDVVVYNNMGQLVKEIKVWDKGEIEMFDVQKGIYLVKVKNSNLFQRIVIR